MHWPALPRVVRCPASSDRALEWKTGYPDIEPVKYSLKEIARIARADGLVFRKSRNPIPTSTVHKILRKRAYCGEYVYKGVTYTGSYEPLISRELWEDVQAVLDGRHLKRPKKRTHDFAYAGLITCGHCGCAMVGEIKKGR
jgi:hypothetical protein